MIIRRHFLSAAIEYCIFVFLSMFIALLPFWHLMFQGKASLAHLFAFASLSALALPLLVMVEWLVQHTFEWQLIDNALIKKRTHSPNDELLRIDLRQVLRFHASREVPWVGKVWKVSLTMKEIVETPPVPGTINSGPIHLRFGMRRPCRRA